MPPGSSKPGERWKAHTTGFVLCGGKSLRMGVDKALLTDARGQSMLQRALSRLEPICGEVLLACGRAPRYGDLGRELVLDQRADGGPLAGLEASLSRARTPWTLVLACDMPRASTEHLLALLARTEADDLDVCMFETEGGAEPLFAAYSARCLPAVRAALDRGERRMVGFHAVPVEGRALRIAALSARGTNAAQNLNTPADWDEFQGGSR